MGTSFGPNIVVETISTIRMNNFTNGVSVLVAVYDITSSFILTRQSSLWNNDEVTNPSKADIF